MIPTLHPLPSAQGRQVFIHPGLPKTATTTLQRHVFPAHPQLCFLGMPARTPDLDWALRHICQADSLYFESDRLHELLDRAIAQSPPDRPILLSYENFLNVKSKDKGLVADRLKALFPSAQIILVLRRQEDMVVARYFNGMRRQIKRKSFIPFDEWFEVARREPYRSVLDDLRYFSVIDYYSRLFGRDRVHVLLFEQLKADPRNYAHLFAGLLGVDGDTFWSLMEGQRENATLSQSYVAFWSRFGRLLPRKLTRKLALRMPRSRGASARISLPEDVRGVIADICARDNKRLADTFSLDLGRFGYTLAAGATQSDVSPDGMPHNAAA